MQKTFTCRKCGCREVVGTMYTKDRICEGCGKLTEFELTNALDDAEKEIKRLKEEIAELNKKLDEAENPCEDCDFQYT